MQQIRSFYHALATGQYYESRPEKFDPAFAVDATLLKNLRDFRDMLIQGEERLDILMDHAFIGRTLFLCYLLDRGIVSVETPGRSAAENPTPAMRFADHLSTLPFNDQRNYLFGLFENLKEKFNGNMFDQDLAAEKDLIRKPHLDNLIDFLGGHQVKSRQRQFPFWLYDFKMIPIEAISAIYQDFLATEDRKKQRNRGAIYTPRFLAEMVVDMAVQDDPQLMDDGFLDPACGSGVFLVILFNRLANRWVQGGKKEWDFIEKAEALQNILRRQIRGVDVEETACRIASFSLYLAYLDFFDPPDIRAYMVKTGKRLPKLIDYGDDPNRPAADIPVIRKGDFLAEDIFSGETFGCVIGNPPWKGRGTKQLAQKFMQKAPGYLLENGVGRLLLPTKILQNRTDAFQAEWLLEVTLEEVMQLADYRRLLFQGAKTPAFIARFKKRKPDPNRHRISFAAPKFNRDGLRQSVITVNPSARTWISLAEVITATQNEYTPVVWKRRFK